MNPLASKCILTECLQFPKLILAPSIRFLRTKSNLIPSPQTNKNEKLVKIAIIGVPNSGKSTFINSLVNHRTCPISNKVHTTRSFSKAICVKNNSQVILFDTPGLVTDNEIKKHHLEKTFTSSFRHSIQHSDLVGVIHDVSNQWTRNELHPTVLSALQAYANVPSFLVLNKIDTLKSKRVLLDLARLLTEDTLAPKGFSPKAISRSKETRDVKEEIKLKTKRTGWSNFSAIFMISALTGNGVDDVMKFFLNHTKKASWEYSATEFTDQPPEEIIVQSVRARLLDYLPQEIPYMLESQLEFYTVEKGKIFASVQVMCPSERIERLVCGLANGKLKQITERVTSDLVETFGQPVSLTVATIAKKRDK